MAQPFPCKREGLSFIRASRFHLRGTDESYTAREPMKPKSDQATPISERVAQSTPRIEFLEDSSTSDAPGNDSPHELLVISKGPGRPQVILPKLPPGNENRRAEDDPDDEDPDSDGFTELLRGVAAAPPIPLGQSPAAVQTLAPRPGDVIDERYRIVEKLGTGGMGIVFSAWDPRAGRHVAIKWMVPHSLNAHAALERFRREAHVGKGVEHPNLVKIFDLVLHDGGACIVMDLLIGETLSEILQYGPMTPAQILPIVISACRGVTALHDSGILHRDLKPGNIFISGNTASDQVKVIDYGLSKFLDHKPGSWSAHAIVGTPGYMAPEQAMNAPDLDHRADIYSLGAIVFHALSGLRPYQSSRLLQQLVPGVSERLSAVIMRALSKERNERQHSVREFMSDLEACQI